MQYISTRDSQAKPVGGAQAILHGLAPDGGLYVAYNKEQTSENKDHIFPPYFPADLKQKSYTQLAEEIFSAYLDDFSPNELKSIVKLAYANKAFPATIAPCVQVGPFMVLELFHGPTCAFKDFALAALPHLLTLSATKTGRAGETIVLVATSGDTGKAAQEGFASAPGCRIIVFYPANGVSEMQEKQMLTGGGAYTAALAVKGNFDDCQNGVKAIFSDTAMNQNLQKEGMYFSSANSINFGRLLPQIVYYYHAYAQMLQQGCLKTGQSIDIAVPTGNFGNILAAYYAQRMGLPVRRLICASNENDVLTEAITTGHYNSHRPFIKTASPSMDILVSSNFERFLFEMNGRNGAALAADLQQFGTNGYLHINEEIRSNWQGLLYGGSATGNITARTMAEVFYKYNYLLDPHSAVGWAVASRFFEPTENVPLLLAATASPYKFPVAALRALEASCTGLSCEEQLHLLAERSKTTIPAPLAALSNLKARPRREIAPEDMRETVLELLGL